MSNGNGNGNGYLTPPTPDDFRQMFSMFADEDKYPDAMIQMWLDQAPCDPLVWGKRYQLGTLLWTAHELAKFGPDGLASASIAGQTGVPNNKSVDSVSIGYDTTLSKVEGAGPYNLTIYGQQFWQLAQYVGAGSIPVQIGAASPAPPGSGPAWPGPWPFPGIAGFSS